ncbi:MAG TPA: creatininase family protein [Isosphaeraceae bacterium]|jgi:creatinine amidohydrolase|nr:creatininase family protein [Isosphaeraceae bacterium]
MTRAAVISTLALLAAAVAFANVREGDVVSTREMADINWMEFKEVVPSKIDTVLLPTGTLEPHGVINNGADITAPVALARKIAREANAMIAPAIPYGITGSMDAYPGAFSISEEAYRAYVRDVLVGLAKNGFKTIVVLNGHGGPQTAVLNQVAAEVGREKKVRTLVINWWSYAADVTQQVFGEDGGHAGWNETAYIQAIDPKLVHRERYKDSLATPNPAPGSYSAYPAPSSIGLYKAGQGYVKFDQAKADDYFARVNRKVLNLILDTRKKWDEAGL